MSRHATRTWTFRLGPGMISDHSDQAAGKKFNPALPVQAVGAPQLSRQPSPAARFRQLVDTDQGEFPTTSLEETLQSQEVTRRIKTRKPDPAPETIEETASIAAQEVARKIVLEPVIAAVYNLDYACLLLPRFPQHHMTGDLLDKLGEWVPAYLHRLRLAARIYFGQA